MVNVEQIKNDLYDLSGQDFINKYFLSNGSWYFEEILGYNKHESFEREKELKEQIKKHFNLNNDEIYMVGSGKIGLSLSPNKTFQPFRIDDSIKKPSDIDIAIISNEIYHEYWDLFRASYSPQFSYSYNFISREIYRGYINERNINEIPNCRKPWKLKTKKLKKLFTSEFHFQHEVTYRIYRNINDFFEYFSQSLAELKRGV